MLNEIDGKGGIDVGMVLERFQVKRFLNDYQRWMNEQQSNTSLSTIQTADELVSFITNAESGIHITDELVRDMEMWMDFSIHDIVMTFRKHKLNTKSALLFLRENQERYFTLSHLVKCPEGHVHGMYPPDSGVDGDELFCRYCEAEFKAPPKLHQLVVYNWIDQQ